MADLKEKMLSSRLTCNQYFETIDYMGKGLFEIE